MRRSLGLVGALGALTFFVPPRLAQAQGAELAPTTPDAGAPRLQPAAESGPANTSSASAPEDLSAIRVELARQARELEALKARESARAHEPPAVRVSGYVQVDFVPYNQASQNEISYSTDSPLNQNRFNLRRGHLRLDAERRFVSAALEVDANTTNGAQVRPIDAEVTLRWPDRSSPGAPFVTVSAGLMRIPFGFEVQEHDALRPFLERSTVSRAFFPGEHDLGARARAQYRFLDLSVALMNGHPIADRVFPALAPTARKEVVARLGMSTELVPRVRLELGVSLDTGEGFHQGTPTTKDQLQWSDDNGDGIVQATEVQVISGSSASASAQFQRFALGADARLAVQIAPRAELDLRAEVMRASNLDRGLEVADPIGAGHDMRELGWYVGATQEITPWGQVGIRYDRYDPDQDAREGQAAVVVPRDRSYSSLALLALLRWDNARLSCEYDINRNALGRDSNGSPTNLKSDAFTVRGQVRF